MLIIKIIDKMFNFILISFFIIAISFSAYALYDINMIQDDIKLQGDILKYKPQKYKKETTSFNLDELQKNVNEDICGWLKIDGTNIDYPIMYPSTALEYLEKSYDGSLSVSGSIFMDIKNSRLFEDDYMVIYGHNVADKLMFADIKKFKDIEFFNNYKGGKLYIKDEIYDIKIISFNILDSNRDLAYKVDEYRLGKNDILINNFEKSAINRNDIVVSTDDKFVLLTTCNGVGTSERAVLFCKLEKTSDNDKTISNVDKDEKQRKQNIKEKLSDEKIKSYDPDKEQSKKEVIQTKDYEKKNATSIIGSISKYYYIFLIILFVITIGIYIKIFKMKKKKNIYK